MLTSRESSSSPAPTKASDRRIDERHDLTGANVRLLARKVQYVLHLKDLSCTGLCALTDAPLAPGDRVFLLFEHTEPFEAEIRWIRNALFGAAFVEQLPLTTLRSLRRSRNRRTGRR
jgi:hypothetical protein